MDVFEAHIDSIDGERTVCEVKVRKLWVGVGGVIKNQKERNVPKNGILIASFSQVDTFVPGIFHEIVLDVERLGRWQGVQKD